MFTLSGLSSFDEIYLAYRAKFIRFALFYVPNRQAAEDIVTDSFVYYWENKSRLPKDTNDSVASGNTFWNSGIGGMEASTENFFFRGMRAF